MGNVHDHYIIGNVLGVGRFGVVREGANKHTKKLCAIKIINKKKHLKTSAAEKIVRNEIKLMRVIARVANVRHHPHLVSLHEHYEDDFLIYIVMDSLKGGDLLDHLVDDGGTGGASISDSFNNGEDSNSNNNSKTNRDSYYTEYHIMLITKQILNAVHALHDVGVIHRDIKPENILYEDTMQDIEGESGGSDDSKGFQEMTGSIQYPTDILKIADFSLAGTMRQFHKEYLETGVKVVVGTPGYIAPESLNNATYTTASDMYAVGVCVYTMLIGYPPVSGSSKDEVFQKTRNGDWGFNKKDWSPITNEAKNFVWELLHVDPSKRPSALDALQHKWLLPTVEINNDNGIKDTIPIYHIPLSRSKSRLKVFNSKRNLKIAAFNALLSSRSSSSNLNHQSSSGGSSSGNNRASRTTFRRGSSLKDQVRSMKPSPSCPDLQSLRSSASNDNIKGLACGRQSDAYKTFQQYAKVGMDSQVGYTGGSRGGSGGINERKGNISNNSISGMSRSHSVGGSLASIVNTVADESPTSIRRAGQMRSHMMMATITESTEPSSLGKSSRGSYGTSIGDSLPRFTPGSLSTYSKNEMLRIQSSGGGSGIGNSGRFGGNYQQEQCDFKKKKEENDGGVSKMLSSSYESSNDSPLGF
jgi:calcium/calmodulin-dependent protein kinase I